MKFRQTNVPGHRERFTCEKDKNARRRHSAARPELSGKTALFPRNDRPYGLKCFAFQTEIALVFTALAGCANRAEAQTGPGAAGCHMPGSDTGHTRHKDHEMPAAGQPEKTLARRLQEFIGMADDIRGKQSVVGGRQHMHRTAGLFRHLRRKEDIRNPLEALHLHTHNHKECKPTS